MIGRNNTRRCCLLLMIVLSFALIPSVLFAQTPASSPANPGAARAGENRSALSTWISDAGIGALASVVVALITAWFSFRASKGAAKTAAQNQINKIDWNLLLTDDTIRAIGDRGKFVTEHQISTKLLQEVALPQFADVFKNGIGKMDNDVAVEFGRRGGFVFEGKMLDALVNEKTADARRRLWQWMRDDSLVAQMMAAKSPRENEELLYPVVQAMKNMFLREESAKKEAASGT